MFRLLLRHDSWGLQLSKRCVRSRKTLDSRLRGNDVGEWWNDVGEWWNDVGEWGNDGCGCGNDVGEWGNDGCRDDGHGCGYDGRWIYGLGAIHCQ